MKNHPKKVKLGFLVSGRGSNMLAIFNACKRDKLDADPVVVISNNATAGALEYAQKEGLPAFYLSTKTHPKNLDEVITETLKSHAVDWVILAGYRKKIGPKLLKEFQDKIFNIHPSLLPKHGGKGMFGIDVHKSVLVAGDLTTGVTIHLVNAEYDQGRVLAQSIVPVQEEDTSEILATRVLKVEHEFYSKVLQGVIEETLNNASLEFTS